MVVSGSRLGALVALAGLASFPAVGEATQPDPPQDGDGSLVLVLDASSSMLEDDAAAEPRIDAVRPALDEVIGRLESDHRVGVRVFGAGNGTADACADSELLVPIDKDNHDALAAVVAEYAPGGESPIGFALEQAAGDLGSDGRRSILLVADGEDTCDHDPCQVARDLAAGDLDLVINVVGLNVDGGARDDLRCIARVGHGTYFDAHGTDTIAAAVGRLAAGAFRPPALAGIPVDGTATTPPQLTAGNVYTDVVGAIGQTRSYLIRRSTPGSSIHVGFGAVLGQLQIIPFEEREWDGWVHLEIDTVDGESCGLDTQMRLDGAWPMLAAGITVFADPDVEQEPCVDEPELALSVTLTDFDDSVAGIPFELSVVEEHRLRPGVLLPDSAEYGNVNWESMTVDGAGGRVVGGSSFYDAPTLDAGSYTGDLLPGEATFFRVQLDWGQWLQVQADFPKPTAAQAAYEPGTFGSINVISPGGGDVTEESMNGTEAFSAYWIWPDQPAQLASATAPVRWWNREEAVTGQRFATLPGDYFVAISATLDSDGDAAVIPFTFTVDVFGTAGEGAPKYDGDPTGNSGPLPTATAPSPTAPNTVDAVAEPPGTTVAGTRPDRDSDNDLSPILLGALGLAGAGLAGHGAMRLLRRRGRPADAKANVLIGSSGPGPAPRGPPQRRSG